VTQRTIKSYLYHKLVFVCNVGGGGIVDDGREGRGLALGWEDMFACRGLQLSFCGYGRGVTKRC
jgi:hypothetical protein